MESEYPQILARVEIPGQFPVQWARVSKKRYVVSYGHEYKTFSGSDSCVDVAEYFGHCVRHAIECNEGLDK
jgi:hypothetical protein